MLSLDVDVCIIVVFEVLKVWTSYFSAWIADKVNLALVAHDVAHSITKVVVQVDTCKLIIKSSYHKLGQY